MGYAVRAPWSFAPLTSASAPRSAILKRRSTVLLGDDCCPWLECQIKKYKTSKMFTIGFDISFCPPVCDPETEIYCPTWGCCPVPAGESWFKCQIKKYKTSKFFTICYVKKRKPTILLGDAAQFHQGRSGSAVRVQTFMAVLLPKMTVLDWNAK